MHSKGHNIGDALQFFTALEKRAAFDLITQEGQANPGLANLRFDR